MTTTTNEAVESETVSERPPRQGRPPAFSDASMSYLGSLFPGTNRRTLVNHAYQGFLWLCDPNAMRSGKFHSSRTGSRAYQPTILTELGRLWDEDDIIEQALWVCSLRPRPKAKDAVRQLRAVRLGDIPRDGMVDDLLYDALKDTLDYFLTRHDLTWAQVATVFDDLSSYASSFEDELDEEAT